ncbi:MAG: stage II sporulation protein M [Acidobacteriota bacterium]
MADTFIEKRKANWKRLEELIERLRQASGARGLRRLTRDEVRQLGRDYRRVASDLAIARVESRDQRLVSYLNNLVIRTHSLIYRSESQGLRSIYTFYRFDFPAIFRRTSGYTLAVFIIFIAIAAFSFVASWRDDDFAEFAYVPVEIVRDIRAQKMWTGELNQQAPLGAAFIMANNIGVGFRTFALSVLPVAGTFYALAPSALQFGSINALIIKYEMRLKLLSFVAVHGVLEFAAIFIAGGAGLMIGLAILWPGDRTRRHALLERGGLAIKLLAGCIPLLVIAGLIEAFISPLPIHAAYKFATSAITAIGLAAYLVSNR